MTIEHTLNGRERVQIYLVLTGKVYTSRVFEKFFADKNMIFDSKELSALSSAYIILVDRQELPFEEKFRDARRPKFSDAEIRERAIAVFLQARGSGRPDLNSMEEFVKTFTSRMEKQSATCTSDKGAGAWSERAREIGQAYFGDQFNDFAKLSNVKSSIALIIPASPYTNLTDTWETNIGFKLPDPPPFGLDDIYTLHEVGHVLFAFPSELKHGKDIAYTNEMMADVYALKTYRDKGGDPEHIQAYIDSRRIMALTGKAYEQYNTAPACEAALNGKPIPSYKEAFRTVREIQIRLLSELSGQDLLDSSSKGDLWTVSNEKILHQVADYGIRNVMKALDKVVKNPGNMSPEVLAEAKASKRAFGYFVLNERGPESTNSNQLNGKVTPRKVESVRQERVEKTQAEKPVGKKIEDGDPKVQEILENFMKKKPSKYLDPEEITIKEEDVRRALKNAGYDVDELMDKKLKAQSARLNDGAADEKIRDFLTKEGSKYGTETSVANEIKHILDQKKIAQAAVTKELMDQLKEGAARRNRLNAAVQRTPYRPQGRRRLTASTAGQRYITGQSLGE
ncbi:MAG: hypothetical protein PHS57_02355 [Alphaproteobacteria bacterium]|nr:hypothetical protein [Alphaproteobacteria bacterium]